MSCMKSEGCMAYGLAALDADPLLLLELAVGN